jgi:hypothetical protein
MYGSSNNSPIAARKEKHLGRNAEAHTMFRVLVLLGFGFFITGCSTTASRGDQGRKASIESLFTDDSGDLFPITENDLVDAPAAKSIIQEINPEQIKAEYVQYRHKPHRISK